MSACSATNLKVIDTFYYNKLMYFKATKFALTTNIMKTNKETK